MFKGIMAAKGGRLEGCLQFLWHRQFFGDRVGFSFSIRQFLMLLCLKHTSWMCFTGFNLILPQHCACTIRGKWLYTLAVHLLKIIMKYTQILHVQISLILMLSLCYTSRSFVKAEDVIVMSSGLSWFGLETSLQIHSKRLCYKTLV